MPEQPCTRDSVGARRREESRDWYFEATKANLDRAGFFHKNAGFCSDGSNHFTAYMYLFVAFNNLYNWHAWRCARAGDSQPEKIKSAVRSLTDQAVRKIYTPNYSKRISVLNDRRPKQIDDGECDLDVHGVLKMDQYFTGSTISSCVAHVEPASLATTGADPTEQRDTIAEVAAKLLYTVRNNQFHAVKGAIDPDDREVLETAYALLHPISLALLKAMRQSAE